MKILLRQLQIMHQMLRLSIKSQKMWKTFRNCETPNREATISSLKKSKIFLCGFRVMQELSTATTLDFIMELLNIVRKTQKQYFYINFYPAPQQETPETHILLQHAKRALYLDRTVHPKQNTLLICDSCIGVHTLPKKGLYPYTKILNRFFGLVSVLPNRSYALYNLL